MAGDAAGWSRAEVLTLVNLTDGTKSQTDNRLDADPHFVPAPAIAASILKTEVESKDGLNGFHLLMHVGAGPKRTRDRPADGLGSLLDTLKVRGYRFVTVDAMAL